jgi:site-specific recombinase XerD
MLVVVNTSNRGNRPMETSPAGLVHDKAPDALAALATSWRRSLAARRVSPATIGTYSTSVEQLSAFLHDRGMPETVGAIRREHVEAFILDVLERRAPATAHNRFRGCQAFFRWCLDEGEVRVSPMERMKPPKLPEAPVPVIRDVELRKLLAVCEKDRSFNGRRDAAILRCLLDSGIRRAELLGLKLADVDLDGGLLRVTGKGSRTRMVPIGTTTVQALDRYLRLRAKRPDADSPTFWLGRKGSLGETGLAVLVRQRGQQAGLGDHVHPHQLRHTYAHAMLSGGMAESDLMALAGWKSRDMLTRYAASTRAERAIAAGRAMSPADRLDDHRK